MAEGKLDNLAENLLFRILTMYSRIDFSCPFDPQIISKFQVNSDGTQATAVLRSMFKFPEDSEVHIQCDVAQCNGGCTNEVCPGDVLTAGLVGKQPTGTGAEDGTMLAATTVFVLDPADAPRTYYCYADNTTWY